MQKIVKHSKSLEDEGWDGHSLVWFVQGGDKGTKIMKKSYPVYLLFFHQTRSTWRRSSGQCGWTDVRRSSLRRCHNWRTKMVISWKFLSQGLFSLSPFTCPWPWAGWQRQTWPPSLAVLQTCSRIWRPSWAWAWWTFPSYHWPTC